MTFNKILKIVTIVGLAIFTTVGFAKVNFDPNQLEHFEQTNQCVGCDLSSMVIYDENHSQANLDESNLSEAWAPDANFSEAILTNANLTDIELGEANLSGANFQGSILYGADFSYANLYQAKITQQQLAQASSVCGAILPDGSIEQCN